MSFFRTIRGNPLKKLNLKPNAIDIDAPMAKDYGLIDEILEPEKKNAGPAL